MQKVLSSKLLYDGILFTVRQDEVEIKEKPYKKPKQKDLRKELSILHR